MTEGVGGKPIEADHEVEGDFTVASLVSQINCLTTKIFEVEDQCRRQGKYIPLHTKKTRENDKIHVENMLQKFSKRSSINIRCCTKCERMWKR